MMKKILSVAILLLIMCMAVGCDNEKGDTYTIPDVFGLNYTDAIAVLESDGFSVNAIGTNVGTFSDKLLYPLERVDKGTVFKIDDYIIDNNGNLNKNYDVFYDDGLVSADKSVVIYYAKEDYVIEEGGAHDTSTPPASELPVETTSPAETESKEDDNSIDPDFKAAMDSYEKFFDEYVAIMKKYQKNPTDISILSDYAKYMAQYADMMQKLDKWKNEDLNTAETAYYIDVQARITKKLLEIA